MLCLHVHQIIICVVPPRITPFQFGEEPMNFGEPASIQCTISGGDWPMSVEWLLNGYHIPAHLEIATSKFTRHTHVLGIESVTGNHAGNYTCVAKNQAGKATYTASLVVNGVLSLRNIKCRITFFTFNYYNFILILPQSPSNCL